MTQSVKEVLEGHRAAVHAQMRAAMEAAAQPFSAELARIDAALKAIEPDGQAVIRQYEEHKLLDYYREAIERQKRARSDGLTLKQRVLQVLKDKPGGATAIEILDAINARWDLDVPRTSLSPQLSRLKDERQVILSDKIWYLPGEQEAPTAETIGAPSAGTAGSPGGSPKLSPTGSTPVVSTISLFPPDSRKEES